MSLQVASLMLGMSIAAKVKENIESTNKDSFTTEEVLNLIMKSVMDCTDALSDLEKKKQEEKESPEDLINKGLDKMNES